MAIHTLCDDDNVDDDDDHDDSGDDDDDDDDYDDDDNNNNNNNIVVVVVIIIIIIIIERLRDQCDHKPLSLCSRRWKRSQDILFPSRNEAKTGELGGRVEK